MNWVLLIEFIFLSGSEFFPGMALGMLKFDVLFEFEMYPTCADPVWNPKAKYDVWGRGKVVFWSFKPLSG